MKRLAWTTEFDDGAARAKTLSRRPEWGRRSEVTHVLTVLAALCDDARLDGIAFVNVGHLVARTGIRADEIERVIAEFVALGVFTERINANGTRLLAPAAALRPIHRLLGWCEVGPTHDAV